MAAVFTGCSLGLPDRADYLEGVPLKLTAEHFPLPRSLHELVAQRFTTAGSTPPDMQPMELNELIGYLRNIKTLELTPLNSVLAQTEAIGDPAIPAAEHVAILQWLGTAFEQWEYQFSLEEPLCSQLRRLKPLAATLAISDPQFLTPGAHPLHRILDSLQSGAVGWHGGLGRAGLAIEKQLSATVDRALAWFDSPETDLAALAAEVVTSTERDLARAGRIVQRMIETEQGRIKTVEAKRAAAEMINSALQQFRAPASIGKFLKGPWYESAQLVVLKFGTASEQWAQMSATSTALLESVQASVGDQDPAKRQQLFELVTRLPRELKRWLLSLHHDSDAVEDEMGVVEYVHMQILRKHPLELEQTELIPVAAAASADTTKDALSSIETGQWFRLAGGDGAPLRARLVLRIEGHELLFANQAGIKVLQTSDAEFAGLVERGKASPLDSGMSFSRCLARAAGIEDVADLDGLLSASVLQARGEEEERQRQEERNLQREQARAAQRAREEEEAQRLQLESEQAALRARERQEEERQALEQAEAEELQREWDEAQKRQRQRRDAERAAEAPAAPEPRQPLEVVPTKPAEEELPLNRESIEATGGSAQSPTPDTTAESPAVALPMGAWLGFHDGDTPLLAKLAVHDREDDNYIFVNRSGIKMRQLNGQELIQLMEQGLVDILETRSNFRDQITRAKSKSED